MIVNVGKKAIDFIFSQETGGKEFYEKYAAKPSWPKGDSGITVGGGVDLGYNTPAEIEKNWKGLISDEMIHLMQSVSGLKGQKAEGALTKSLHDGIYIPYDTAYKQFLKAVPDEARKTLAAFPEADKLNPDTLGVLISLVYNRGGGMKDKDASQDRREMRVIRDAVPKKDYKEIAKQIRSMKRLWDGVPEFKGDKETKFSGLVLRREKEAEIVEQSIIKVFKPEDIQVFVL